MKKLIAVISVLGIFACTNPSIEEGLDRLTQSLAELDAAFVALNVEQMKLDLAAAEAAVEQMTEDLAASEAELAAIAEDLVWGDDFDTSVLEDLTSIEQIVLNITTRLQQAREQIEDMPTAESVAALAAQIKEVGEGIDMLVFVADYDYDGVMNGLDQCPDTAIEDINNVNNVGCSPAQLGG